MPAADTTRNRFTFRNRVALLRSGPGYFDVLLDLIGKARTEIHLQTYILEPDATGTRVLRALQEACTRGVSVYLVIDAYGSQNLGDSLEQELQRSGIRIRRYGRLISRGRLHLGRRLHHKVTVVDGTTALVGGINISDHYSGMDGSLPWLDFAAVVQGEAARQLQLICRQSWEGNPWPALKKGVHHHLGILPAVNRSPVRVTQNDFLRRKTATARSYRQAIRQAKGSLLFVGGYFLPGGLARRLLKRAGRRGVSITLLVSAKSDVGLVRNSRRYLYGWLLRHGFRIFEYEPSNVHGKMLVRDRDFVSIGSYDLNNLSTYSNIELNLDIRDGNFSDATLREIEGILSRDCREITLEIYGRDNWLERLKCWGSYQIVKTLFVLSVWLASNRDRDF